MLGGQWGSTEGFKAGDHRSEPENQLSFDKMSAPCTFHPLLSFPFHSLMSSWTSLSRSLVLAPGAWRREVLAFGRATLPGQSSQG